MFEFRAAEKLREQISLWKVAAMEGKSDREKRQADRSKASDTSVQWKHLLVKVDEHGPAGRQCDSHYASPLELNFLIEEFFQTETMTQ